MRYSVTFWWIYSVYPDKWEKCPFPSPWHYSTSGVIDLLQKQRIWRKGEKPRAGQGWIEYAGATTMEAKTIKKTKISTIPHVAPSLFPMPALPNVCTGPTLISAGCPAFWWNWLSQTSVLSCSNISFITKSYHPTGQGGSPPVHNPRDSIQVEVIKLEEFQKKKNVSHDESLFYTAIEIS